jgi:hypothetical protein
MVMRRLSLITVVLFFLVAVPGVLAQDPELGEPAPMFKEPWLVAGTAWIPAEELVEAAVVDECDYVPEFLDHFGGADVHPQWPASNEMEDILHFTGIEIDTEYGCERAKPGETYLAIAAVEGRCAIAANIVNVTDGAGNELEGVLFYENWPSMGDANQFPSDGVDPPLFNEGIGGFTNVDGNVAWGFGPGSFIVPGDPGIGGPFSIWGSSCLETTCKYGVWVGSDAFKFTGWFGGTDHCTLNPIFVTRVKEGDELPAGGLRLGYLIDGILQGSVLLEQDVPPPPSEIGTFVVIDEDGKVIGHVPAE